MLSIELPGVHDASISTASDSVTSFAKLWLDACLREHPNYHGLTIKASKAPTRVLDVGPSDGSRNPRLCILLDDDRVKYLTLSHCWGNAETMELIASTHSRLLEGVQLELLSRTYRDAVLITRVLGYRCLWIDSLCIFQDSAED